MATSPARNSTMLNPVSCQIPIAASDSNAVSFCVRKFCMGAPTESRMRLMSPMLGMSMNSHTIAMARMLAVTGRK